MAERKWERLYYDDWFAQEGLDLIKGNKVEEPPSSPISLDSPMQRSSSSWRG